MDGFFIKPLIRILTRSSPFFNPAVRFLNDLTGVLAQ